MRLRILTTLLVFALIFAFVSPLKAAERLRDCDKSLLFLVLAIVPVFVFFRVFKWYLLARQEVKDLSLAKIVPDYLWGMAVGLVTPARIGELARVRGLNVSKKMGAGLFFLEKLLEVGVLALLCFVALLFVRLVPFWVLSAGVVSALILFLLIWKALDQSEWRQELKSAISELKLFGCTFCSFLCFVIFCLQAYLVLKSMYVPVGIDIVFLFPIILLGNFIPVTVGGFGIRETFAIVILKQRGIPSEVAVNSIAVVALLDLVLPALVGVFMNLYSRVPYARTSE
jgi:uncharacterized membrane protein YbhN (UPF0104 family)